MQYLNVCLLASSILLVSSNHSFADSFQCPPDWDGRSKIGQSSEKPGVLRCDYEGDLDVKNCESVEANQQRGIHCVKVTRPDPHQLLILQVRAHETVAKASVRKDCPSTWEDHQLKLVNLGGNTIHATGGQCIYDGRIALEECLKWGGKKSFVGGNANRATCQKENENREIQMIQLNEWSDKDWEAVLPVGPHGYLQAK